MHNPNAVPPADYLLFLVRVAVCLEAAFQQMRQRTDAKIGNSHAFRKVFAEGVWHGQYSEEFKNCSGMPDVTLTRDQESLKRAPLIERSRQWITASVAAGTARAARYEEYWVDRFAHISAANFIRRLGQPEQPLLTPSIADPVFRADFIRRHGLTGTPAHGTEHSA